MRYRDPEGGTYPVLLIDDILARYFNMKIWIRCDLVASDVSATEGARF